MFTEEWLQIGRCLIPNPNFVICKSPMFAMKKSVDVDVELTRLTATNKRSRHNAFIPRDFCRNLIYDSFVCLVMDGL